MMIGYFAMIRVNQDLTKKPVRRTEQFLKQLGENAKPPVDASLKTAAAAALDSEDDLDELADVLKKTLPQLDRVDVVVIDEEKLHVKWASQSPLFAVRTGGKGISFPAAKLALAKYAAGTETIVHQDIKQQSEPDLRFMARVLGASVHVPIRVGGKPALLNFWSTEKDAFPEQAVALIREVATLARPNEKSASP
jgi:hypothetical protein